MSAKPSLVVALVLTVTVTVTAAVPLLGSTGRAVATSKASPRAPVIVSPAPGSRTASATTQISFLGVAPSAIGNVEVSGSATGRHPGTLRPYSTGNGASFIPARPFRPGERVTVRTRLSVAGVPAGSSGSWTFVVGRRVNVPIPPSHPPVTANQPGVLHFATDARLLPPAVTVTTGASTSGGDYFLAPKGSVGAAGPMIVDGAGHLVWFDQLDSGRAFDLNVQHLGTKPVLTWFQGIVVDAHGAGEDVIADTSYRTIAVLRGANGFQPDLHEFQLEPSGVALVTSYQALRWNLAPDGGSTNGTVWDGIVQEIDVRTGLVEYEWHSLDHVPVNLSDYQAPKAQRSIFDYFHVNSIQQLANGDLLVSARNTSAAYEIAPKAGGAIVFELGGKQSSFTMGPGAAFSLQHDVQELPDGTFTIFDDQSPPVASRALLLHLDQSQHLVSVVRAIEHTPPVPAAALGNVQTLPNGNLVVEWGTSPYFSRYGADGSVLFDAHLPSGDDTYRAYFAPWYATPRTRPLLAVTAGPGTRVTAHMSWNGATAVTRWTVLSGASPSTLRPVATVARVNFESSVAIAHPGRFLEVRAESASGRVLGTSAIHRGG